ncbi:MAG: DUF87 domain-containing protein [Rhizobiales bacterium]|nr:DUF87 domain-containing protein [Hyphomicrobiales bacterium]
MESIAAELLPRVLSVNGAQTSVGLTKSYLDHLEDLPPTVGRFLGVRRGTSLLIGMISEVSMERPSVTRDTGFYAVAKLDLLGEIKDISTAGARFHRGVTNYPAIDDPALLMTSRELGLIYEVPDANMVRVGSLHQDPSISASINVDEVLNKHFAILGTTGVGKSSAVSLVLGEIMRAKPSLRLFVLDGHNEYGRCFGERSHVLNPRNLRLPFWLFNFEELVDVIFGGRPGGHDETILLSEAIPVAKGMYAARTDRLRRSDPKSTGYTVDTPVPYRLEDLLAQLNEGMGRLENRASRIHYFKLITRIEQVRNDPRYTFMFDNANVGGDTMADVLRDLFNLRPDDPPMTVMQLAGFPVEVVDSVVSVLCRMAFDLGLWSDGAVPLLFVCEEAHRYASADRTIGFGPTRRALSRIAKEGRKYGVFLGLVTQRPAELDATIISQCSTLFVMRMANERDQALVRSAVPDAGANLLAFLSSLGVREALAFGEGVALPVRFTFRSLEAHEIPRSEAVSDGPRAGGDFLDMAIERWRGSTMSAKRIGDDAPAAIEVPETPPPPAVERSRLLRKPAEAQAAVRQEFANPFVRRPTT